MRSLLITGATGMIGSAIVREAIKDGFDITCIVRCNSPRIKNLPLNANVRIVECNIDEYSSLEIERPHDVFIHLAWDKTTVGGRDDVDCQLANIRYTLDAVRIAKKCGCSVFIGAGSQAEYGVKNISLSSDLPTDPESGYGIAKYTAGKLSFLLCQQLGMRFNWIRVLSLYGENDGENTLISYCIRELKAGRSPELTKCDQIWDYLHCEDAARAFLAVSKHGVDGKFYPLGSGTGRKLSEYLEDIRNAINTNVELGLGMKDYYPHQPMYLVADISELQNDTGWRPQLDFSSSVQSLIKREEF